jgi:transposase-like protein
VDRLTFSKPTKLHIGSVEASCPQCGGDRFVRRRQTTYAKADHFVCVSCRAETTYTLLLAHVIDATKARSELVLKEAQALRDAIKKPAES